MLRAFSTVVVLFVAVALAGCAVQSPDPLETPSLLYGEWTVAGPDGEKAILDLEPDGSMTVQSMPKQILLGPFDDRWTDPIVWSDVVDRSGRWSVQTNGDHRYITLSYSPQVTGISGSVLDVDRDARIYFAIDEDAGQELFFTKSPG